MDRAGKRRERQRGAPRWSGRGRSASVSEAPLSRTVESTVRDDWQELQNGDVCRVVAFGQHAAPKLFYQIQAFLAAGENPEVQQLSAGISIGGPDNDGAGLALLVPLPDGKNLTVLLGWSGAGAVVETPRVVQTRRGPILIASMAAMVTSHPWMMLSTVSSTAPGEK